MNKVIYLANQHVTLLSILTLFLLSLYLFLFGIMPGWNNINSDFPNYYTSSKLILDEEDLSQVYNDEWFQDKIYKYGINQAGKFSPFPPATALVMIPLAVLKPVTAKRFYIIINVLILFTIVFLFKKIGGFSYINSFIIILLSGTAIVNNFLLGQFYLILLFILTAGYYLQLRNKDFYGGSLWGVAASIKYFPLVFLPLFIQRKNFKLVSGFAALTLLVNLICLLIFGVDVYREFLSSVFMSHINGKLSSQSSFAYQFQSWNSFLRILFVFDPVENPFPLFNWQEGFVIIRFITYSTILFTSTITFLKIRNHPQSLPLNIGLLAVTLFLLSPASASYHYLILALPILLLIKVAKENRHNFALPLFIIIYTLIGFLPAVINKLFPVYETSLILAFNRLWLVLILYVCLVAYIWKNFIHRKGLEKTQ